MSQENVVAEIPESQEVQEHREAQANSVENPVDLKKAAERFSDDRYDLGGELVDDGIIRSQARRGVRAEARANTKTKLKKATAIAGSVIALAGAGQVSGVNQDIVSGAGGQLSALGAEVEDIVTGDPDPLANYTGDDADKNIIAGDQDRLNTDNTELSASQPEALYDGGHTYDAPTEQTLPPPPEDIEFGQKMAEQNEQAVLRATEPLNQETGGASVIEPSGGVQAQIR